MIPYLSDEWNDFAFPVRWCELLRDAPHHAPWWNGNVSCIILFCGGESPWTPLLPLVPMSPRMFSQCIGVLGTGQARIDSTLRSACSTYRSCTKHSRQQASRHRPRQLQPQTAIPADWRYNCAPPAFHAERPASHSLRLQYSKIDSC